MTLNTYVCKYAINITNMLKYGYNILQNDSIKFCIRIKGYFCIKNSSKLKH